MTFNVGLTRLIFTPFNYNFVPRVAERVAILPGALRAELADVICLQEVFESRLFKKLRAELRESYPYAYHDNKGWKLFNKGLAIFSKYPFEHIGEVGFKTIGVEKFVRKGASVVRFLGGPHKDLVLANVHFPYGGYVGTAQAFAPIVTLRNRAIEHLHQVLERVGSLVVMAGDFNFGPTVAEQNYEYLLSLGYTNVTGEAVSWDPKNPLNKLFPLVKEHALDHIFVNTRFGERLGEFTHRVLFTEPVPLHHGGTTHLSDHYGVMATVRY